MPKNPVDYTSRTSLAALAVVGCLLLLGLVPSREVCGMLFKRANILSDLISFDETPAGREIEIALVDDEIEVDMDSVAVQAADSVVADSITTTFEWVLSRGGGVGECDSVLCGRSGRAECAEVDSTSSWIRPDSALLSPALVEIEDFDTLSESRLEVFYRKLISGRGAVRIAVLGDSFIEGDILTADLRETLQEAFGGCGAGFAPAASPLTGFRRTVKTQSLGWTAHNIMQRKKTPSPAAESFFVSGWVDLPASGASVRWSCTGARKHIECCRRARMLFISRDSSRVEVTVNDTLRRTFEIAASESVRQIVVCGEIGSVGMKVLGGNDGFTAYGVMMEGDDGVTVDNYSVRSNNGQAMFWTSPAVNGRINSLVGGYDLVILQYGLNIMQKGVTGYAKYAEQVERMVDFTRRCFPGAAVLVMSVSERAVKGDGGVFETMDALPYMVRSQREAARRSGAAFWDTSEAMRTQGGIGRFVEQGWAGKDYTHINYAGGRRIALSLFDAINRGAWRADSLRELRRRIEAEARAAVLEPGRDYLCDEESACEVPAHPVIPVL